MASSDTTLKANTDSVFRNTERDTNAELIAASIAYARHLTRTLGFNLVQLEGLSNADDAPVIRFLRAVQRYENEIK